MSKTNNIAALKTSDDDSVSVSEPMTTAPKKKLKVGLALIIISLLVGGAFAGYFLFRENNLEMNEPCMLTIKDSNNPILEITFAPSDSEIVMTEEKVKEFELAIVEAYNDASGGCSDEFKRWMYGIHLIEQNVSKQAVLEDEVDASIAHTFDNKYSSVIRLETLISCDGCSEDDAFASVYATSFGSRASGRKLGVGGPLSTKTIFDKVVEADEKLGLPSIRFIDVFTKAAGSYGVQHSSYYEEAASSTTGSIGGKGLKGTKGTSADIDDAATEDAAGTKGAKGSKGTKGAKGSKGSKGTKDAGRSCSDTGKGKGKGKGDSTSKGKGDSTSKGKGDSTSKGKGDSTSKGKGKGDSTGKGKGGKGGDCTPATAPDPTPSPTLRPVEDTIVVPPTAEPTRFVYTPQPTYPPTPLPSPRPTPDPTPLPTLAPVTNTIIPPPTDQPTRFVYTPQPTNPPTYPPTPLPTPNPTPDPTPRPTPRPTPLPTNAPFEEAQTLPPTPNPTPDPTPQPFSNPTPSPSEAPSGSPSCGDNPCDLYFTSDTPSSCDPIVLAIIEVDSWCGVRWDPWCVVTYSQCYETTNCDPTSIDTIATEGGVDVTNIDCPENTSDVVTLNPLTVPPIADGATEGTCPDSFPGTGASCGQTNLQCQYYYGEIEWLCNCAGNPLEFFCKPKTD